VRTASNGRGAPAEGTVHSKAPPHDRQQFWIDTCREVREMRLVSPRKSELHQQHGCRFSVPTTQQVQFILNALDSALPGWDRNHPELFYQTLELNFPELVRACPARRRG
jgi:hypothetical protein